MAKKLLVAAIGVVVVAAGWWLTWSAPEVVQPNVGPQPARVVAASEAGLPPSPDEPSTGERIDVTARNAAAMATGALRIAVSWADGQPAVGIVVAIEPRPEEGGFLAQQRQATDANGVVEWRELLPHAFTVSASHGGERRVTVVADRIEELALVIPQGVDLRGVVVDANGAPVAGAAIVLGPTSVGITSDRLLDATFADRNGAFFLRSVPENYLVAAFADGLLGSGLSRVVELAAKTPVQLQLGVAAGSIEGAVVDEQGQPLAGVWVAQGELQSGREQPPLRVVQSDARGRFVLIGARASYGCALYAAAANRSPWQGAVGVRSGQRSFVEIRLLPACSLRGVVVDRDGATVCEPEVRVIDPNFVDEPDRRPAWSRPRISATERGDYLVANLAAGRVRVVVEDRLARRAYADLEIEPGEHRVHDLVVASLPAIRGTVVDASGGPLVGWRVAATAAPPGKSPRATVTGSDGGFVLTGCAPTPHSVRCISPDGLWPVLQQRGVVPGGDPLLLRVQAESMPSCFLRGSIAAEESGVVMVFLSGADPGDARIARPGESFEFGPLPAGAYCLRVANSQVPVPLAAAADVGSHVLAPGQHLDIGIVRVPEPGELALALVGLDGTPASNAIVQFAGLGSSMVSIHVPVIDGRGVANVAPGTYLPTSYSRVGYIEHAPIEVRRGERTFVRLQVVQGVHRHVRYQLTMGEPTHAAAIWRKEGVAVHSHWLQLGAWQDQPAERSHYFTPGNWELELSLADGRVERFPFFVTTEVRGPMLEVRVPR